MELIMEQMPVVLPALNAGFLQTLKLFIVTLAGSLPLGLLIAFGGGLGLLKSMGILLGTIVLLLINIFNPYNPYLLLQKPVVSKPDERTYELGLAICERLREMETN